VPFLRPPSFLKLQTKCDIILLIRQDDMFRIISLSNLACAVALALNADFHRGDSREIPVKPV
jgi:hypothetical protein